MVTDKFGKKEAELLKGIAIVMMILHHFLGFPGWVSADNQWKWFFSGENYLLSTLTSYCKICVGLYIFITGYSLNIKKSTFKGNIKRVLSFLLRYWHYYALYLLIGFIFSEPTPPFNILLAQLVGMCTGTGYNWNYNKYIHPVFAWYVSVYILFMLSFHLIKKLCTKGPLIDFLYIYLVLNISFIILKIISILIIQIPEPLIQLSRLFTIYAPIGMIGYIFSKYNLDQLFCAWIRTYLINRNLQTLSGFTVLLMSIVLRRITAMKLGLYQVIVGAVSIEFVYIILFFYTFMLLLPLLKKSAISKILSLFCKYNFGIWMLQGLFFTPLLTFQKFVYWGKYPLIIWLTASSILLVLSIMIDYLKNRMNKILRKTRVRHC